MSGSDSAVSEKPVVGGSAGGLAPDVAVSAPASATRASCSAVILPKSGVSLIVKGVSLTDNLRVPTGELRLLTVTGDIEPRIAPVSVLGPGDAVRGMQVARLYSSSSDPDDESDREMRRGESSN